MYIHRAKRSGMKGIILAGGRGTRLHPITLSTSKQLLPIYDKPMIYYPLSVLMLAGIREILIISTPGDIPRFQELFQDGAHLGLSLSYAAQAEPLGIAHSFILGETFIGQDSVALILGDNIFYGHDLDALLTSYEGLKEGAVIFGYEVKDPTRYGVICLDEEKRVVDIIEKPRVPPSPYAVTGLYFYDNTVVDIAKDLIPSSRGELEITDVNRAYLMRGDLQLHIFERGFAWLDMGTCDSLQMAASYVQAIQERQGIKIACLEEIAYKKGFIDEEQLQRLASALKNCDYGRYLQTRVLSNVRAFEKR
jgi:glucose-1-phosphate thymidylyltransferase